MSVAVLPIAAQFGWSPAVQGLVQSSFLWGYTASQALGGVLADAHGGRRVVSTAILLFCAFTLLTPLALLAPGALGAPQLALPLLLLCRCAVGMGQGVVMPSVSSLLAASVPPARRAAGVGAAFAGFHGGTIFGLLLSPLVLNLLSWPWLFVAFSLLALPVLAVWHGSLPPSQQADRPAAAAPSSFATLLRSRSVLAILAANAVNHCCYFVFLFMLPSYFNAFWALDVRSSALFSLLPWLAMGGCSYAAGAVADSLLPRWGATAVRKTAQGVAFLLPALLLLLALPAAQSAHQALAVLTLALAAASFGQAGFVSNIQDVGGRSAGRLFGLTNTVGCLAGIGGTTAAGLVLQRGLPGWGLLFSAMATLYLLGALVYCVAAGSETEF